jgi:hypothetical protein
LTGVAGAEEVPFPEESAGFAPELPPVLSWRSLTLPSLE